VKVIVDTDLCVGHGRCYALAPDVFGADDFGHAEVLVADVDGALAEQARIGVDNCPERAIRLEE
jgi:ferredoxin